MKTDREFWVDYIKLFACVLVVLGHFFQSMVKSNILPSSELFVWFNTSIYYFHVPLFFICSGYLYQKYTKVYNLNTWKSNIIKKMIVLGIPYFIFSGITWISKKIFSGSLNNDIKGIIDTLFLHPTSPYWYLYTLLFIFMVTPTIKKTYSVIIFFVLSLGLKFFIITQNWIETIYCISSICKNEIWFVLGMVIAIFGIKIPRMRLLGSIIAVLFICLSIAYYKITSPIFVFLMGLLGCFASILLIYKSNNYKVLDRVASYTMPIFLMHTLFAAPIRVILIKFGVLNSIIHVFIGIIISFIGPIFAMKILYFLRLNWIVYPKKIK